MNENDAITMYVTVSFDIGRRFGLGEQSLQITSDPTLIGAILPNLRGNVICHMLTTGLEAALREAEAAD